MRTALRAAACALLCALGSVLPALAGQWRSDGQGGYFDEDNCHYVAAGDRWVRDFCVAYNETGTVATTSIELDGERQEQFTFVLNDARWVYVADHLLGKELAVSRENSREIYLVTDSGWQRLGAPAVPPLPKDFAPSKGRPETQAPFGKAARRLSEVVGIARAPRCLFSSLGCG